MPDMPEWNWRSENGRFEEEIGFHDIWNAVQLFSVEWLASFLSILDGRATKESEGNYRRRITQCCVFIVFSFGFRRRQTDKIYFKINENRILLLFILL